MRTQGFRGYVFASILIAPFAASAATETWDGGGINDFFFTSLNWADNTAPVSDVLNTDIVFAGALRRVPIVFSAFSARSITLDDSALSFAVQGAELSVGTGGILNESAASLAFNTPINFVSATPDVLAGTGGVLFGNTVTLPTTRLSVHGSGPTRFENVVGTAQIVKWDSGTMTWAPTAPIDCELLMDSGNVVMEADGSTDVFTGEINVIGDSTFRMDESVTLDGADLTQASGAIVVVSTGATLTLQNGASVSGSGSFGYSGAHIVVTGTGSTFSRSAGFGVIGGTLTVSAGGSVSIAGQFNVAGIGAAATVDGVGSSLSVGGLLLGQSGLDGVLTFRNGATGSFGEMLIAVAGMNGTDGTLNIQNGASVSATGNLSIATEEFTQTGNVTISGTNSTLTLNGDVTVTIGGASASSATLTVQSGGTFHSGTNTTRVNPTGVVAISKGNFHAHGLLIIDGGQLTRDSLGTLTVDGTLLVESGGDVSITGSHDQLSTLRVNGIGSTFTTTGNLTFGGGSVPVIEAGGTVSSGGQISIASAGFALFTVQGAGSNLTGSSLVIGSMTSGGILDFTEDSSGTFGAVTIAPAGIGSGTLQVEGGSDVTVSSLTVATTVTNHTGTVNVTGADSFLTINGTGAVTIGALSASTASLNVLSEGHFMSGTGLTTINPTGTLAINGGFYTSNGNLALNGGLLTRASQGSFTIAAGQTFTVQAGGDAVISGTYSVSPGSTTTVTGAGSSLSATNTFSVNSGSALNVLNGGSVSAGPAQIRVGYAGNGAITVDGTGANLSGGLLSIGQGATNTGNVTFRNGSTGSFLGISVDLSGNAGTSGTLSIESGALVTGTALAVAISEAANSGTVTITGSGSTLTISGHAEVGAPSTSTATVNVLSGGTLNCGDPFTLRATGTFNINGGIVNLNGPLILEGGTLNFPAGELHIVDAFTVGASGLLGPSVVFDTTRQFSTTSSSTINAGAVLTFHGGTFSAAPLVNNGDLNFSNGNTNVHGEVTWNPGSHVTISGDGTVTFSIDPVVHNTSEVLIGAGASAVFAGSQSGPGSFTGPGAVHLNGEHHPGASAGLVSFGGDVFYGPSATLELELGGIVRGSGYDSLNVAGNLALDGTMNVVLIGGFQPAPGDVFNLFDWGTLSGAFDTVNLPALNGGLSWNSSQLYSNGTIVVVPEPASAALLITGLNWLLMGRLRRRRHFRETQ